jgi:hypothetical protein
MGVDSSDSSSSSSSSDSSSIYIDYWLIYVFLIIGLLL